MYEFSCEQKFSFLWDICQGVWLLVIWYCIFSSFLFFKKIAKLFQSGSVILYSHQQCISDLVSPASSGAFDVVAIFFF